MIKKKLKLWILFILFENVKYLNHVRIISKITDLFVFYVFQLLSLSHCGLISLILLQKDLFLSVQIDQFTLSFWTFNLHRIM